MHQAFCAFCLFLIHFLLAQHSWPSLGNIILPARGQFSWPGWSFRRLDQEAKPVWKWRVPTHSQVSFSYSDAYTVSLRCCLCFPPSPLLCYCGEQMWQATTCISGLGRFPELCPLQQCLRWIRKILGIAVVTLYASEILLDGAGKRKPFPPKTTSWHRAERSDRRGGMKPETAAGK